MFTIKNWFASFFLQTDAVKRLRNSNKQETAPVQEVVIEPSQEEQQTSSQRIKITKKKTLRNSMTDIPAFETNPASGRYGHWFNGQEKYQGNRRRHSDSWCRLEAFLSSTDPQELKALDPSWNTRIGGGTPEFVMHEQEETAVHKVLSDSVTL